jgi:uncharacterized membrane protein YdbT with pleckstrin-like domain
MVLIFLGFSYYSGTAAYRKEEYILKEDKIIRKSGGLFSDAEQELYIKNITHLKLNLGFVQQKLFSTGSVIIESAGSQAAEVVLSSVENPRKIFDHLQEKLKEAGFQIDRTELLEEETPSKLAVLLELGAIVLGSSLVILYVFLMPSFIIPAVLLGIPYLIWKYKKLANKTYQLYRGSIVLEEKFLSKNTTIVPIENLADSNIDQNFLNKILGLYDLTLSCQGSGQEIKFKNIKKAKQFDEKIDKLLSSKEAVSLETQKVKQSSEEKSKDKLEPKEEPQKTQRGLDSIPEKYKGIKRDLKKMILTPIIGTVVALILFGSTFLIFWLSLDIAGGQVAFTTYISGAIFAVVFLFIFGIFPIGKKLMKYYATEYSLKKQSIREEYNLFKTDIKEFSDDKITGIYFSESILDRFFDTYTIHFWSLGSNEDIEFTDIKQDKELENLLEEKFGFDISQENQNIFPEFSLNEMLKQKTIQLIVGGVFFLVLLIASLFIAVQAESEVWVLFVVNFVFWFLFMGYLVGSYFYDRWYYNNSHLSFYSDFLTCQQGLITKYQYFVNYNDIRGIVTTQYPWSTRGELKFKVSGEHTVGAGKNKVSSSNEFYLSFIENIPAKDELVDLILEQKEDFRKMEQIEKNIDQYREEDIITSGPNVFNDIISTITFSVIILPFAILLPITLPVRILKAKKKSYHLRSYRVLKKWGILFRKQQSIVFRKIDHINKNQGFLNKMLNNGNITINTVASSSTEMSLSNMSGYEEFYEKIQEIY